MKRSARWIATGGVLYAVGLLVGVGAQGAAINGPRGEADDYLAMFAVAGLLLVVGGVITFVGIVKLASNVDSSFSVLLAYVGDDGQPQSPRQPAAQDGGWASRPAGQHAGGQYGPDQYGSDQYGNPQHPSPPHSGPYQTQGSQQSPPPVLSAPPAWDGSTQKSL